MNSQNSKDLSTKYWEKLHILFPILFEHYDVKSAMSNPIFKATARRLSHIHFVQYKNETRNEQEGSNALEAKCWVSYRVRAHRQNTLTALHRKALFVFRRSSLSLYFNAMKVVPNLIPRFLLSISPTDPLCPVIFLFLLLPGHETYSTWSPFLYARFFSFPAV